MSLTSKVICNICKLFLENPIALPCGCLICSEHVLTNHNKIIGQMIPERWEETGEWKKIENPNMFYFYFTTEDLKLCLIKKGTKVCMSSNS